MNIVSHIQSSILTLLSILGCIDALSLSQLENLNLCGYLGAHCQDNCGEHRELVHKWGIALCKNSKRCCAYPQPTTVVNQRDNSCQRQHGRCQAWYHTCNGTKVQHECGQAWESCCVPEGARADYIGSSGSSTNNTVISPPSPQSYQPSSPSPTPTSATNNADQCGYRRPLRQKRIIGGTRSPPGMWPWHVGIKSALGSTYCSATLIGHKWALTAAHCFKRIRNISFYRIVTGTHTSQTQRSYAIKRIIKHNLYEEHVHTNNHVAHAHKHDIALVELHDSIPPEDQVRPVCLPSVMDNYESKTCWLTGWGSTGNDNSDQDYRLRHVQGQVLSRTQCQSFWGSLVDGKMLCFGNNEQGACRGDSGGGMFCQNDQGYFTIAGIISWGSAQCNRRATVLTDITQYSEWITQHMNS